jgi:tRNA-splicing endonuclease subunit Sen2
MTAEQVREKRRAERAQFKLDRAQAIANVAAEAEKIFQKEGRVLTVEDNRALIPSAATWKPTAATSSTLTPAGYAEPQPVSALATQEGDEEPLEDLEHLQLTLPEAWFLIWTMDCLIVLHPDTVRRVLLYTPAIQLPISSRSMKR